VVSEGVCPRKYALPSFESGTIKPDALEVADLQQVRWSGHGSPIAIDKPCPGIEVRSVAEIVVGSGRSVERNARTGDGEARNRLERFGRLETICPIFEGISDVPACQKTT
jgi:hypothetical protein